MNNLPSLHEALFPIREKLAETGFAVNLLSDEEMAVCFLASLNDVKDREQAILLMLTVIAMKATTALMPPPETRGN